MAPTLGTDRLIEEDERVEGTVEEIVRGAAYLSGERVDLTSEATLPSVTTVTPEGMSPTPSLETVQTPDNAAHDDQPLRERIVDYVMHPSSWLLGGVAIAVVALGGGLDSLTRHLSARETVTSAPVTEPTTGRQNKDHPNAGEQEPGAAAHDSSRASAIGDENSARVPPSLYNSGNALPQIERPKTVQTAVGEVEVVSLASVTPSQTAVTLTFSDRSIVPLPPPEPPEPKGWRWPFSPKPTPPVTHPADVAVALLSAPITQPDVQTSSAMAPLSTDLLRQGGIDLVNIAGTGIVRASVPALSDTLELLKQSSVLSVGAGLNLEDAARPQIVDVKGHRIAILGYVDTHLYKANGDMPGNNPVSLRRLTKDIEAIRDQVDWIVVTYQWESAQWEMDAASTPSEQQVEFAHFAVDHGADLVVGHNATVMQGSEIYQDRAIVYSLGPVPGVSQAKEHSDENLAPKEVRSTVTSDAPLGSVNHSLPPSGVHERPARSNSPANHESVSDRVMDSGDGIDLTAQRLDQITAMLKVTIRDDRRMSVEFVPVIQGDTTTEFVDDDSKTTQKVREAIQTASQTFDTPLSTNSPVWIDLDRRTVDQFSGSDAESFQPNNSTAPFIDESAE
ncbi:MAG: CapA family protein [Symploca sp. SIO2B6]|nr:CapA family protein [Symploca sp. SIO2B6]